MGENQVKEIINASNFSLFFIDKYQRITLKDHCSIEVIKEFTDYFDVEMDHIKLGSEFRCNGSDGYLFRLNDVLEMEETANFDGFDFDYDFRIVESPNELGDLIFERNTDNNARLLADTAGTG